MAERLRREQRLAVLNRERITYLNNIDPVFARSSIDPGYRFCVPYLWRIVGPGYRYATIDREIESLAAAFDLAQIKRMALIDDARVSLGLVLIMLGYSPNTSDPVAIGAARNWLLTVRPYIQHLAANDGQDMLQQDRVDIVVEWSGGLLQVARTDDNLRFAIPQEGSLFTVDSMCIPTGSAQQAAAEQFIDFILTDNLLLIINELTRILKSEQQQVNASFSTTIWIGFWIVMWMIGSSAAIFIGGSWFINRYFTQLLITLTNAARRVAEGWRETPIPLVGTDEIGDLARSLARLTTSLNATIATLEERIQQRTAQLQDALREKETVLVRSQQQ